MSWERPRIPQSTTHVALTLFFAPFRPTQKQSRCEAILRTQPGARFAKELHLAAIEAEEERKREQLKQAAIGSVAAAVAVGVIGGVAGLMLSGKNKH